MTVTCLRNVTALITDNHPLSICGPFRITELLTGATIARRSRGGLFPGFRLPSRLENLGDRVSFSLRRTILPPVVRQLEEY